MERKDSPGKKRHSQKELRRQQLAREKRIHALRLWGPLAVVIIALAAILVRRALEPEVEGVVFTANLPGGQHNPEALSANPGVPPVGGPHSSSALTCDVYTEPVDAARAVHSLEHGGVWITYQPDLAAGEVAILQDIANREFSLLLSPYPAQNSPIVMTSWGAQLQINWASDERIEDFINRYRGRAPEGGVGC
jgi:hypothetical protein